MKKYLLLSGLCLILLSGCNKTEATGESLTQRVSTTVAEMLTETTSEHIADNQEEASISDIYDKIVAQGKLKPLTQLNDEYIKSYYKIDVTKLKDYVFAQACDSTSADTLILIKVNDINDVEEIKAGVQGIIEQKKIELENYLPEQYNKVVNSEIVVQEDFIYLVIADNPQEIVIG